MTTRRRDGVTLVELLIVILVMLMITAITIPAISPALANRKTREAARMIDVFINGARNRALQAGHSFGVMIEREPGQPSVATKLSYIEQPPNYTGDYATSKINFLGNGGFGAWATYDPATPNLKISPQPTSVSPLDGDFVFPKNDVGWVENIAPGDLMFLNGNDGVLYRIYAGEPFIDVDGNGVFTPGEPFNDVDGSGYIDSTTMPPVGVGYTGPKPTTLDAATGYFNSVPQPPFWGSPTAFWTFTYADPTLAAQYMTPTGFKLLGGIVTPILLPGITPSKDQIDGMTGNPIPGSANSTSNFQFIRRPIKTSSATVQLPDSTVIDLGTNFTDSSSNVVAVGGSGLDIVAPTSATFGAFSTFRPNPQFDPAVTSGAAADTTPIMITFDPSGVVDRVFSWDEKNFVAPWGWQGRQATAPIYLLIGRRDLVGGDPEALARIQQGQPPKTPAYNLQDPNSLWIAINPQTGSVVTAENSVTFDLTSTTVPTAQPQMQAYYNLQAYLARAIAREMQGTGGR